MHAFMIMVPLTIIRTVMTERISPRFANRWLIGVVCGSTSILSIVVQPSSDGAIQLDNAWIAIGIASLYGGLRTGGVGAGIMCGYMLLASDPRFWHVWAAGSILVLLLACPIALRINELDSRRKYWLSSLVAGWAYLLNALMFREGQTQTALSPMDWLAYAAGGVLQIVLTVLCVHFIERGVQLHALRITLQRKEAELRQKDKELHHMDTELQKYDMLSVMSELARSSQSVDRRERLHSAGQDVARRSGEVLHEYRRR